MVGIDIVRISRIEDLTKHEQFFDRMFTSEEKEYIASRRHNHNTIAGMLAAKEAISKAFGTGITKNLAFKDMEILHDSSGAPFVNVENSSINNLMKNKGIKSIDINISHDGDYAIAVAKLGEKVGKLEDVDLDFSIDLLKREDDANKYDFGKVLIIGGKKGMTGSVLLSSEAAYRAGAGLVYLLVPSVVSQVVESKTTEQIVECIDDDGECEFGDFEKDKLLNVIQDKSVVAIGPGLGKGKYAKKIIEILVENFSGPIIVDADGINIMAENPELLVDNIYLTPHNMEFSRLSSYSLNEINYDRLGTVQNYLDKHNINMVLKGKDSIVAKGDKYFINPTGNSGMATAGSGDVLTGVIAALLAKKESFRMMKLAVLVHGLAGDLAIEKYGKTSLMARDILEYLPRAFGEIDGN